MQANRCPECGQRLNTNYCDICMRKVPFAGGRPRKYRDPWDYSSSHREETGHKCITFDTPETTTSKQTFTANKTTFPKQTPVFPQRKQSKQSKSKAATVVAIVLAIVSLLPSVFGLFESMDVSEPVPEYNLEAFYPEAELPVLQPDVLYDDGKISVLADSLGLYYNEPCLSLLIENQSEQDITVGVEGVAVNGYMLDVGMSAEVPAGEACQAFLSLYQYALEESGIEQISWVDLRLRIYDRSYNEVGYVDLARIETDAADTYTQPVLPSGWEMIQDSGLSVRLMDMQLPGRDGCEMKLHLENQTEDTVWWYTSAVRVNGQEAEGGCIVMLLPGTSAVERVFISDLFDMDLSDLSEITEIDIAYTIEYSDNVNLLDQVTGSVLFNPNELPDSC